MYKKIEIRLFFLVIFLMTGSLSAQDDIKTEPLEKSEPVLTEATKEGDNTEKQNQQEEKKKQERSTAITSSMFIKVSSPQKTQLLMKESAIELGGFPIQINDDTIVFKVPPKKLLEVIQIFSTFGIVIDKSINRTDLTSRIAKLEGQLKSKQEILERLRTFFDQSDLESTLDIENSMTRLVNEIESVKGQLRLSKEQAKWSIIHVSFSFRQRDNILYVTSPFEWLNSANLNRFLEDF